jgi:cytochrome c oxidase subunit 3
MLCQRYEYINCDFTISSGIYGSNFFALTGFHGFHVTVGMIGLGVCWTRSLMGNNFFGKGARCDCFI